MSLGELLFGNKTLMELNIGNNGIDHDGIIVNMLGMIGARLDFELEEQLSAGLEPRQPRISFDRLGNCHSFWENAAPKPRHRKAVFAEAQFQL